RNRSFHDFRALGRFNGLPEDQQQIQDPVGDLRTEIMRRAQAFRGRFDQQLLIVQQLVGPIPIEVRQPREEGGLRAAPGRLSARL
ncbi:MAG TPA: hypothetical protein PLV25_02340, partial [Opitutales bacterium]|nr:hypothetical protein [Opitutales bacterium]